MKRLEVESMLAVLRDARIEWGKARTEFFAGYDVALRRLLFEAAANYMSVRDVAAILKVSPKTVRERMRVIGLDGRSKTLLSQKASEALLVNAELMGIEPGEMDLTSPLAYLPMGEQMKKELRDRSVSQVHEIEDEPVSGNEEDSASTRAWDAWAARWDIHRTHPTMRKAFIAGYQTPKAPSDPDENTVLVRVDRETWEEHEVNGECPVASGCCGCHLDGAVRA